MPPLMLAGLRFMLVASPGAAVCRPAGHSAAPAAGHGLTISFGQFCLCSALSAWACRRGWRRWKGASLFYHHSWRLRLWRTLTGQAAGDRAGDLRRAGAGGGEPGGEHVPLVGFMLTPAAPSWACGNIFNKKIMSQATRPPIISLVVWSASRCCQRLCLPRG